MHRLARISARWLGVGLAATLSAVTLGLALTGRLDLFINPDSNWFAVSMAVLALVGTALSFLLPLGAEDDHGHDHGHGPAPASAPAPQRLTVAERREAERREAEAAEDERIEAARLAAARLAEAPDAHDATPADLDPTAFATRAEYRAAVARAAAAPPADDAEEDGDVGGWQPSVSLRPARAVDLAHAAAADDAHRIGVHGADLDDHGAEPHAHGADHAHVSEAEDAHAHPPRGFWATTAVVVGGVLATAVVVAALVLPPRSLSAELAMSRDLGSPPLFGGEDVVQLATTGDLSKFGIGQWATVFQTAPDPRAFDGTEITLTGFVAPASDGNPDAMRLTRLVITHCVIDAQPATLPVESAKWQSSYAVGQWVTIAGKVKETDDGKLVVVPDTVTAIQEPADPYEY